MVSIKPGRGPSMMGGFGAIAGAVFAVFWTLMTASMGAPAFFPIIGVLMIFLCAGQAVYHFYNATQKNRMSVFDITQRGEEPDPIATAMGRETHGRSPERHNPTGEPRQFEGSFCPFCGKPVEETFDFCPHCGKDI